MEAWIRWKCKISVWVCSPASFGGPPYLHPFMSHTVSISSSFLMSQPCHSWYTVISGHQAFWSPHYLSTSFLFPLSISQENAPCFPKGLSSDLSQRNEGPQIHGCQPRPQMNYCLVTSFWKEFQRCLGFVFSSWEEKDKSVLWDTVPAPLATAVDHVGDGIS